MLRPSLSSLLKASNSTRSIMTSSLPPLRNVLAKSKSPYLLQHADNPVAWQEWNSETIARAKEEDKPIFLSIGYSACHWCHVLAHESFEDQGIAELMNKYFINVKVDREERPDVDRVYMTYLQATQGSGGWPLSVWLTPTLEPIFAGTYYPKPRFRSILAKIEELWEDDRERCIASGKDVMQQLQDMNSGATRASASLVDVLASKPADKVYTHLVKTHDPRYGGFSPAGGSSKGPKFPSCSLTTTFLARVAVHSGDDERQETARSMAVKMLKSIWTGGIRDWVGGGVARYSVDEKWKVPHFEKMLYDQAQLVTAALDVARITRPFTSQDLDFDHPKTEEDKDYVSLLDLADNILTYSIRDLRSSAGGFFSAEDADSAEARGGKKVEGAFYVWSQQEIEDVVEKDVVDIFKYFFGIKLDGNVDPAHDIQGELVGKNILCREHSEDEAANKFKTDAVTVRLKIERACAALKAFRDGHRERPGLDDKILTSWNGLMISALASAVNVLPSSRYPVADQVAQVAAEVVQFIKTNLYDAENGKLFRSWRDGRGPTAQADDYAFLIQGLLDLYEATGTDNYLLFAVDLQTKQDELFFDEAHGGYFASAPDEHIIVRMKDSQDGAEPSATSVSVHNNSRLSLLASTNFAKYEERAEMTWLSIASELKQVPRAFATSVAGLMDLEAGYREFIVIGSSNDPDTEKLLQTIRGEEYMPNKVVIHIDPARPPTGLAAINETVKDLIDKLSVANSSQGVSLRICEGGVCGMPIEGLEEARKAVLGTEAQE